MAREEKRIELKPVDDLAATHAPVIRLESKETLERGKQVRLNVVPEEPRAPQRLDLPQHDEDDLRTHQPGIEALIETSGADPDALEQAWEKGAVHRRTIPWGWFVLMGLMLVGSAMWSLKQVREADAQADQILYTTQSVLENDTQQDIEAGKLIDRINTVTKDFFAAKSVEVLCRHVRHPERVKSLMEQYYGGTQISQPAMARSNLLQPLTLDNRANFWMQSVVLQNQETRNLLIEILESGEPKIDWETMVCYQPMAWDEFARDRPTSTSLDFRVYIEPDNFFSHEFADSTQWNSYRLTALDSEETLFGYSKVNDATSGEILTLLNQNGGRRVSVILRISVPEGIQSRRGVVIEKLLSPRWIFLDPPEA